MAISTGISAAAYQKRRRQLMRLAGNDAILVLPAAPEACGSGIVPTTSTTMTMALGDALAIALMEHRKFTPEHFRTFHPGGKLGAALTHVRDIIEKAQADGARLVTGGVGAARGDYALVS